MAEFDNNQSAIQYGESLLASRENERKKQRKRKKRIDRVNIALAGVSIADSFLTRNARKKVSTFTNNLNAEKAHELSNYKQASAFNTELNKYRTENPSINFADSDQYKQGGLIYNAVSNKHADDTRSRYATGLQNSFIDSDGIELEDASAKWQKEIERRTDNSIESLQALYNKHKGYLDTTDIAIKSQYKQILDQGTNDLLSANNTSSIRKMFNKFGITDKNTSTLTEIEKGGVKANINPKLVEQYKKAFKDNAERFETYKEWLDTEDKGYKLNEPDIEIEVGSRATLKNFSNFKEPAALVARTFRLVIRDKVQTDTFTTNKSQNLIDLTNMKDANNETPLKGMDIDGNDDVSLIDIWGKLGRESKRKLLNNIKYNYADQLKLDEGRAEKLGETLKASGSLEEIVEHTKTALLETVSYDIKKDEYNVTRYEDLDRLKKQEGEEIDKPLTINIKGHGLKTPVDFADEYKTTFYNPKISNSVKVEQLKTLRNSFAQESNGTEFLQEFNTILKRAGIEETESTEEERTYSQADIESGQAENLEKTQDIRTTLSLMEKAKIPLPTLKRLKREKSAAEYNVLKENSDKANAFLKSFENQFGSLTLKTSPQPYSRFVMPNEASYEQQLFTLDPERVQNFLDNYDFTSTEVKKKRIDRKIDVEPTKKFLKDVEDREGFRNKVYLDGEGIPTVGFGHKLVGEEKTKYKVGDRVPNNILNEWLVQDSKTAWLGALKQSEDLGIEDLDFIDSLASVNYQLGTSWFKIHKKTWKFLQDKEYDEAAVEAADSDWFKQTPTRVEDFQAAIRNL